VRIDPFALEFLLDDFALDESFGFLEIVHGAYNLRVSGDEVCTDVGVLCADSVLNPN
jgi:hypothetical protein